MRLGRTRDGLDIAIVGGELAQHFRNRLDGDQPRSGGPETREKLAGSGAEIERDPARAETQVLAQPILDRRGIFGPAGGVGLRAGGEAGRGGDVDGIGHDAAPCAGFRAGPI